MSTPRKLSRTAAEPTYRITLIPELPAGVRGGVRLERWSTLCAALAGVLLLCATVGFPWWSALVGHASADYHYWEGREAHRRGEAQIVVQRHWQQAVAADPGYARVRLELARSYIDGQWYGGAIAQCEAVLAHRRNRQEASLAYTYLGYCHYLLGQAETGRTELEMAIRLDPENALAQSVVERLQRQGKLPELDLKPAKS